MNIVVVNDDGIKSDGIKQLALSLKQLGKITVISPNEQKSGAGHAFTCDKPIKFEKIKFAEDIEGYIIYGTPRDCTDFAYNYALRNQKIDLLVSGINLGRNVASDIICSGTCGSASTAINYNIPCMATSLDFGETYDFKMASEYIVKIATWYLKQEIKQGSCLNVNIPNIKKEEIKGIVVAEYGGNNIYNVDPQISFDGQYYFIYNKVISVDNDGKKDLSNDAFALKQGYIVLTPIDLNLVKYDYVDKLKKALETLDI